MLASNKAMSRLSTLCIVAGVVLLLSPIAWVLYTGRQADAVQTAALAAWEADRANPGSPAHSAASTPSSALVLTIPKLGVRRYVPDGATPDHLRRYGLGRITWTSLPDAPGTLGIAGHRTTYGAPFFYLDRLGAGDTILVDYGRRRYTYRVERQITVTPDRADALEDAAGPNSIALVTCSPPHSAAFRLIVFGRLEQEPLASSRAAP